MPNTIYSVSVAKCKEKYSGAKLSFELVAGQTLADVAGLITRESWSPLEWKHGSRAKDNFLKAHFIVLDIDEGMTIQDCTHFCAQEKLDFIIGTTRSHQKEKKTATGFVHPPCDRYRLLILTDGPCEDIDTYRNTIDYFSLFLPIDESCKDLARFFFPCVEIIAAAYAKTTSAHKPFAWLPLSAEQKAQKEKEKQERLEALRNRRGTGIIPSWILTELKKDHFGGGYRHKLCYRIGAELFKLGFDEKYIEDLVGNSTLNIIGEHNARRAAGCGIERAKKEWQD